MACNCNEEGKIINIGMGCCVPVVANADAYYTKSEIDEKLEDIVSSGCCITPEEVDEKISAATDGYATEQWVENKHYITGVDLSNYALKEEIPSLDGYATEQWVEDKHYLTQHQDLSDYALKSEIPDISGLASETYVNNYTYDKATIDQKIGEGGQFDPTQYYTTAQTYNKTEVDNLIPTIPTSNTAFTNDAGYLTEHQPIKTINGNVLVGNGNVQLDIPKIWHGTKAEYNYIEHKDADTIYLIYEN